MKSRNELFTMLMEAESKLSPGSYLFAFKKYNELLKLATHPSLVLICKSRMLFCQFNEKALKADVLISRANSFMVEIESAILAYPSYKTKFEVLKKDMQTILSALGIGQTYWAEYQRKKAYSHIFYEKVITRVKDKIFDNYLEIMEIDSSNASHKIDYLKTLYEELTKASGKKNITAQLPQLAECLAKAYWDYADHAKDLNIKKAYLRFAREKFVEARLNWKRLKSTQGEDLLFPLLTILRALYSLEDSAADKAKFFSAIRGILASNEFQTMIENYNDKEMEDASQSLKILKSPQGIANEHNAWVEGVVRLLVQQGRDDVLMPPPVKPSVKRHRHVDEDANPSRAVKRPRIGEGIFVATLPMDTTNSSPVELEDYPTPTQGR